MLPCGFGGVEHLLELFGLEAKLADAGEEAALLDDALER